MTSDLAPRRLTGDLAVHPLAVGCRAIGGPTVNDGIPVGWSNQSDARSLEGLRRAIEHGANFFDTADVFGHGHSERLLGTLLRDPAYDREDLYLTSKVGWVRGTSPNAYASPHVLHQFQQSCRNLGTDYLDAYFLHTLDFGDDDWFLSEAIDQMLALRESGMVRAIGMRGPHTLGIDGPDAAQYRSARFEKIFRLVKPDVLWIRFNPLIEPPRVGDEDLFSYTARHGVAVLLTEPLAQGLLSGKYDPANPPSFPAGDHRRHKVWFTQPGLSVIDTGLRLLRERFGGSVAHLVRVALQYCLQQADHSAVLAGFTTPEQVTQNYTCLGEPLTDDELRYAEEAYRQMRVGLAGVGGSYRVQVPA